MTKDTWTFEYANVHTWVGPTWVQTLMSPRGTEQDGIGLLDPYQLGVPTLASKKYCSHNPCCPGLPKVRTNEYSCIILALQQF